MLMSVSGKSRDCQRVRPQSYAATEWGRPKALFAPANQRARTRPATFTIMTSAIKVSDERRHGQPLTAPTGQWDDATSVPSARPSPVSAPRDWAASSTPDWRFAKRPRSVTWCPRNALCAQPDQPRHQDRSGRCQHARDLIRMMPSGVVLGTTLCISVGRRSSKASKLRSTRCRCCQLRKVLERLAPAVLCRARSEARIGGIWSPRHGRPRPVPSPIPSAPRATARTQAMLTWTSLASTGHRTSSGASTPASGAQARHPR
jgi:hypothetical protein